jgi:hypothetical protein
MFRAEPFAKEKSGAAAFPLLKREAEAREMNSLARTKRVAFVSMTGGFGSAAFFGLVALSKGDLPSAREWAIYLWPLFGLAIGVGGLVWLWRLYRREPPIPPAAWIIRIDDLIAATFLAALCAAVLPLLLNNRADFERAAPAVAAVAAALYIHGALVASLRALFKLPRRVLFILTHALWTYGLLCVSTLLIYGAILVVMGRFAEMLLFLNAIVRDYDARSEPLTMLRLGIFSLLVGSGLLRLFFHEVPAEKTEPLAPPDVSAG